MSCFLVKARFTKFWQSFSSISRSSISQEIWLFLALASKGLQCVKVVVRVGPGSLPTHCLPVEIDREHCHYSCKVMPGKC